LIPIYLFSYLLPFDLYRYDNDLRARPAYIAENQELNIEPDSK